jgi:GTP-binding protein Era
MITIPEGHRSGFVNILGKPNVGKSTLLNRLMGEKMSIITSKPQTTRHRIFGLLNTDEYQIVFSDTPGIVTDPAYEMHEAMNRFAFSVLEDADILLVITDIYDKEIEHSILVERIQDIEAPIFLLINKIDQASDEQLLNCINAWKEHEIFDEIFPISAKQGTGVDTVLDKISNSLPEGPPYVPKDQLSDRPERFFVSEFIREKIFENYRKEVPYSCEVIIQSYEEDDDRDPPFARIVAFVFVERESQKYIVIGKGGEKIKQVGVEARKDIEEFVGRHVYLELRVKVRPNWRSNKDMLRKLGYQ